MNHESSFRFNKFGTEEALGLLLEEAELDAPTGRVADYIPELARANANDHAHSQELQGGTGRLTLPRPGRYHA